MALPPPASASASAARARHQGWESAAPVPGCPTMPKLYEDLADWYTLLTPREHYEEEAAWYSARLREHARRKGPFKSGLTRPR